jgi:glycosyltransferase involved in cell wall biosynthesis
MVGQDFLVASMNTRCDLSVLSKPGERYTVPSIPPELVVSINPHETCDADFLQAVFNSAPIVVHLHNQLEYLEGTQRNNAIRSLSLASAIVVPAQFLSRAVKVLFPHLPVHVVPNGVPEKLFFPASSDERSAFRKMHRIPTKRFLAGFVGPLTEAKGLQVIKAICEKIGKEDFSLFVQYPDWQAITEAVGTSYREIASEMKTRNPAKITVWPDQTPRFPSRPIRNFDVLIAPSLSEVQPVTAIEALLSGVPIIATRATPFYDELLEAGVNYLWCRTIPLPRRFNDGALEN